MGRSEEKRVGERRQMKISKSFSFACCFGTLDLGVDCGLYTTCTCVHRGGFFYYYLCIFIIQDLFYSKHVCFVLMYFTWQQTQW